MAQAALYRGKADRCEAAARALQDAGELLEEDATDSPDDTTEPTDERSWNRPINPLLFSRMQDFVSARVGYFTNKQFKDWLESEHGIGSEVNADAFNTGLNRLIHQGLLVMRVRPVGRRPGLYRSSRWSPPSNNEPQLKLEGTS